MDKQFFSYDDILRSLGNLNISEIRRLHSSTIDELKLRGIVRTKNNPVGGYTEWLVAKALDLNLQPNSNHGYDGETQDGIKVEIKGRRVTTNNPSRQLSAIRNYADKKFDRLAVVIFDEHYDVDEAVLIPHKVIKYYAKHRKHTNAHILTLDRRVVMDERVTNIKEKVRQALP